MATAVTVDDALPLALQKPGFVIYPDPTTGKFTLEQKGETISGKVIVEIYGMCGEMVMTKVLAGEKKYGFVLSDQRHGLYFVKVVTDDTVETFKLLLTR